MNSIASILYLVILLTFTLSSAVPPHQPIDNDDGLLDPYHSKESSEDDDRLLDWLESNIDRFPQLAPILERISGGSLASPGEIPYQIAIEGPADSGRPNYCGGTLLSSGFVITAAHCLDKVEATTILLGAHNRKLAQEDGRVTREVTAKDFIIHPDYLEGNKVANVALIKLEPPVDFTDRIRPVALPTGEDALKDFANMQSTISGWGYFKTAVNKRAVMLRQAKGRVMTNDECSYFYPGTITDNHICLDGRNRQGTCYGDAGGPQTIIDAKGNKVLIGIATFRAKKGCGTRTASVFTRITYYVDWIRENAHIETLQPSKQQNFIVDRILCATESDLIALSGSHGLTLLELPRRWGANGQYLEGKEHIICRSHNIDEQFFVNNAPLELLQIRWHPSSPSGTHILALISDNTIRVYDESTLKHVWRVGPAPSLPISTPVSNNGSSTTVQSPSSTSVATTVVKSMLSSLGETAVDFDIAPARVVASGKDNVNGSRIINNTGRTTTIETTTSSTTYVINSKVDQTNNNSNRTLGSDSRNGTKQVSGAKERVEWPIVLLRGNGNVYVLCAGIDTAKPHLQGPLTILPQVADNYGVDSCAILVVPSLPPTVVIAESNGKLHNGLLLENEAAENSFSEIDSSLVVYPSEWSINILETVQLELGLPDINKNKSNACPIHLKRDLVNELRIFAYHNTGLHVVMLNFIKQLQQFVDSEDAELTSLNTASQAEYLICTKALESGKMNPVLGFSLFQMPAGIITLLGSGQVLSLNLISDPSLLPSWDLAIENKSFHKHTSDLPIQQIMSESFVTYIRNILKSSTTQQPILSLDKSSEPGAQEAHALLQQAIQVLKDQYFNRHEKARVEIIKRVNILKKLKEQQKKEVALLELEKEKIRDNAERLAEKYEDICDKQQIITRKCQELVNKANLFTPNNALGDKDFINNVEKINEATKKLQSVIENAKKKINTQRMHVNKFMESGELKTIDLPPKQEKTIKEIISQITLEIQSQIKELKKLNSIVNL